MGQPPATERDYTIVKGILASFGLDHVNPAKGIRTAPPPDPRPMDSHAGRIVASCVMAVFFVFLITTIRVAAKIRTKSSRLGWDDWFIIFASLAFFSYAGLKLHMVAHGGIGKHKYNVTYSEMESKIAVSSPSPEKKT